MGLAGMNDRDNTSNEVRSKDINASYGMSFFRPKRKTVDISGSGPIRMMGYLFHVDSYPSNHYFELKELATPLIRIVHRAVKEYKALFTYLNVKDEVEKYIDQIVVLTAKAYDVPDIYFDEWDYRLIVNICKNPVSKAMTYLESTLCNRGEALNRLTSDEQNILFNHEHKCDEFEKIINESKQQIKELDFSLKTYNDFIDEIGISKFPESLLSIYNNENKRKADAEKRIIQTQAEYDQYLASVSKELKHIWIRIIHYNHI